MGEEKQAALELMEIVPVFSIIILAELWRGRDMRTTFPDDLMLLFIIVLLIALKSSCHS